MFFSFTAIDQEGQTRDFFWHTDKLEDGFELLSTVATTHRLIKAQVLDRGVVTALPLALFDGLPFAKPIQGLEKEWQQILAVPVRAQLSEPEHVPVLSCTVFSSTLLSLQVEHELSNILHKSRLHNARRSITGIMLHVKGSIVQVLEGEEKAVDGLYRRIEQDPRHTNVVRVFNRPISHPLFSEWSMGYKPITAHQLETIRAVINADAHIEPAESGDNHIILMTLKTIYEHNHL